MNRSSISWHWAILTKAFVGYLFVCGIACSQESQSSDLDGELARFAKRTLGLLEQQEQTQVTVGTIIGTGKGAIPGGPGLASKLVVELEALKPGIVSDTAVWTIEGRILFGDGKAKVAGAKSNSKLSASDLSVTVFFTLFDQTTQAKIEDKIVVTKLTNLPFITGSTFETSPRADVKESRSDFALSLESPPFIDPQRPSQVRVKQDSLYSLELRAKPIGAEKNDGVPIPAQIEKRPGIVATTTQQFAFAPIGKNQEYEIVVTNDSSAEVAASISVDGINVFTFSEDVLPGTTKSLYSHFVLPPHSELVVPGWHRTADPNRDDNFLAFLVTEYGKGASSKLLSKPAMDGSGGAVTVGISKTFLPEDGAKSASAETTLGRPIKLDQTAVKRAIDPPHAFITIRYDR